MTVVDEDYRPPQRFFIEDAPPKGPGGKRCVACNQHATVAVRKDSAADPWVMYRCDADWPALLEVLDRRGHDLVEARRSQQSTEPDP